MPKTIYAVDKTFILLCLMQLSEIWHHVFLCFAFVNDDTLILAHFKEAKTHTIKKALMGKDIYICVIVPG